MQRGVGTDRSKIFQRIKARRFEINRTLLRNREVHRIDPVLGAELEILAQQEDDLLVSFCRGGRGSCEQRAA
jgi:hypothetical protein